MEYSDELELKNSILRTQKANLVQKLVWYAKLPIMVQKATLGHKTIYREMEAANQEELKKRDQKYEELEWEVSKSKQQLED